MRRLLPIALMLLALAACGDDGEDPIDANRTPDADTRGTISFSWTISDGSAAATCGDVGASAISMTLLPIGVQGTDNEISNCVAADDSGTFNSGPITPRAYDIQITIAASQGDLIDEAITFSNITVDPLDNTDLGDVEFVVDALGNVEFRVSALGAAGGNCDTLANDGADIVAFELVLLQSSVCVPVDFEIYNAAGDTLQATYVTACGDERHDDCIDEDQIIRVTDIGSGPANIEVTGYRTGDLPCYVTTANFNVPGNDLTADLQAINIPLDITQKACVPPK